MAKTIAVANMKGGVGKTTLTVCLAEALAADDQNMKVLIVDADPQASASVSLVGDEKLAKLIEDGKTLDAYLDDQLAHPGGTSQTRLSNLICGNVSSTTHNNIPLDISLLSCGPFLRLVEKEIVRKFIKLNLGENAYEMRLWALIKQEFEFIKKSYDYIIFDCAPSISVLNDVMIRYSDLVILPTIPDFISVYGLSAFLHTVWNYPIGSLPKPTKLPYVIVTKYQNNNQHKKNVEKLKAAAEIEGAKYGIFATHVPQAVQFASALALANDYPTFTLKYSSKLINEVISPLTLEIKEVLDAYAP